MTEWDEIAADYLTGIEQRIIDTVRTFTLVRGFPPTIAEIGVGVGLKSKSTVHRHLLRLVEKGVIVRGDVGQARTIRLTEGEQT